MDNRNYGYTPQCEYRSAITLNIWQIVIIGMIFMIILSDYTQSMISKQFTPIIAILAFVFGISIVFPSFKNLGHKLIQEICSEILCCLRRIFEWGLKHV